MNQPSPNPDRLPPHDDVAEQGVLGCIFADPAKLVECEQRFGNDEVFYDLKNGALYQSLRNMQAEGTPIDLITVQGRLRTMGTLDGIGGVPGLLAISDSVTGTGNLPAYLTTVWEKFLARQQVATSVEIIQEIYAWNGLPEGLWGSISRKRLEWEEKTARGAGQPRELIDPADVYEEFLDEWHNRKKEMSGWALPFALADFTMKLSEISLLVGDSGSGKSTWLSEVVVCAAKQGAKACIASFEMPRRRLLKLMVRQLIGTHRVDDTPEGERRLRDAIGWLQGKLRIYNFLGIADWRRVLDVFAYSHEHDGSNLFVLDNLGLIGIGDEDWEQQQLAMAALSNFAHTRPIHLWGVQHINKSDGSFKQKVRGSKRATDFVDNAIEWQRNEKKREKVAEILALFDIKSITVEEKDRQLGELQEQWDGKIILRKQRFEDGEQANASRYLWFDWKSKQFRANKHAGVIDYTQ